MKKIIFLAFAAIFCIAAQAQSSGDTTSYLSNKNLPAINIMQPDSTWFTNAKIPKNTPVVVVYFSPTCGHCQLAAQEIYDSISMLKDVFFVWATFNSVDEIKTFVDTYKIGHLANFRFGRDPKYAIPAFYKVRFTPTMAVYDKKGHLLQVYEQGAPPSTLAKLIHGNS